MTVESTTQALCDLALRFGEGDEESMVKNLALISMSILFFIILLIVLYLFPIVHERFLLSCFIFTYLYCI